jgi:hypothetical protein
MDSDTPATPLVGVLCMKMANPSCPKHIIIRRFCKTCQFLGLRHLGLTSLHLAHNISFAERGHQPCVVTHNMEDQISASDVGGAVAPPCTGFHFRCPPGLARLRKDNVIMYRYTSIHLFDMNHGSVFVYNNV